MPRRLRHKKVIGRYMFPDDLIINPNKPLPKKVEIVKEEEETNMDLGFSYRDKDAGLFYIDSEVRHNESFDININPTIREKRKTRENIKISIKEMGKYGIKRLLRIKDPNNSNYTINNKILLKSYETFIFIFNIRKSENLNSNINVSIRENESYKAKLPDPMDDILEDILLWD